MVEVELELDNDTILGIAMMAHERDITFNQMVNIIIKQGLEELNSLTNENKLKERLNNE